MTKSSYPVSRVHRTRWVFALKLTDGSVRWLVGHSSREKDGFRETCVLMTDDIEKAHHCCTAECMMTVWPMLIRSHIRNFGEIRRGEIHQAHKVPSFGQ